MSIKQGGNTIAGLQDISGKANVDMDNITTTGNEYMAHQAMPSNRFINLTLGASGTQYTAPADGWFSYYHNGISTSTFYTNNGLYGYSARGDSGIVNYNMIQVKKGTTVTLVYNGSGGVQLLRFVYVEGAQ